MLYFNQNWPPTALYNGRFLFAANARSEEGRALINLIDKDYIHGQTSCTPSSDSHLYEAIFEEYSHAKIFGHSLIGQLLSGLRLVVRLLWLKFEIIFFVKFYYQLRTLFFVEAYPLHEDLVVNQQRETSFNTLIKSEIRIVKSWFSECSKPLLFIVLILSPILVLLGRIMAKNPTIITSEIVNGDLFETNNAAGGLVNNALRREVNSGNLVERKFRKFLLYLRLEKNIENRFHLDWKWFQIKTNTEKDLWYKFRDKLKSHRLNKTIPISYEDYMIGILSFVIDWMGVRTLDKSWFLEIHSLINAIRSDIITEPPSSLIDDPYYHKMINFFYLHGN